MDRDIPNYNPLVNGKIQHKNMQLHYQRLHSIKSTLPSRSALRPSRHKASTPAQLHQEERKTAIEKDNVLLFNKMMHIMKRPDPCNQPTLPPARPHRPSAELTRIQEQNRTMYERLERQKPTIDHRKMQNDRKKNENILKFLGKYSAHSQQNMQPPSLRASNATGGNATRSQFRPRAANSAQYLQQAEMNTAMELRTKPRYSPYELDEEIDEQEFRTHLEGGNRGMKEEPGNRDRRAYSTTYEGTGFRNRQEPFQPIETGPRRAVTRTAPHSAKDIILFKTRQSLGGQPMELSIVRSHNTYEIRASTVSQGEVLKIVLSEEEGNELLEMSNYNYKDIVCRMDIRDGVLQLVQEGEGDQQEAEEIGYRQQPESRAFSKPSMQHYNSSHISEQNDEESYRPADSVYREEPRGARVDSLGPEEESLQLRDVEKREEKKVQEEEEKKDVEKTEEKKDVEKGEEVASGQQTVPPGAGQSHEPIVEVGVYEQALQQQIM